MANNSSKTEDFYDGTLDDSSYIIMGVYMTIVGLISFIGNSLILCLFAKNRLFRQTHINFFVVNIAISNLGESMLGFPFAVVSNFSSRWSFGEIGCSFYGFICYTCVLVTMMTHVAVSLYRYITVFRSTFIQRLLTQQRVSYIIAATWVYALFWALLPFCGLGSYAPEPFKTTCSLNWTSTDKITIVYMSFVLICVLLIPVVTMATAYARILCRTYSQVSSGKVPARENMSGVRNAGHGVHIIGNIESRTTKMVFVSVIMYLAAWLPYGVMSFMSMCGYPINVMASTLPTMLAKSQCAYNPVLYFVAHRRFRISLLEIFGIQINPANNMTTERENVIMNVKEDVREHE